MKLEQFLQAIEIANTGSFSQAARNLLVTQPNLSYSIKSLEDETGIRIFDRTSNGVVPTEEGKLLIDRFRIIQKEYLQVREIVKNPERKHRISLKIGNMDFGRSTGILLETIKRYIGTPIEFSFINYNDINPLLKEVETSRLDFAVIGTLSPFTKKRIVMLNNLTIEYHALAETPICVITGPNNELGMGKDSVSIKDIRPYCLIQNGDPSDDPTYSMPYTIGLTGNTLGEIHVNDRALFYDTILNTQAVGIIAYTPKVFKQNKEWSQFRILPIDDSDVTAQFGWIKNRRIPLSDISSEILQSLARLF